MKPEVKTNKQDKTKKNTNKNIKKTVKKRPQKKKKNAKTVEVLERERLNIKDIGFINHSIKLYIKYKELKIKLTNGIGTSDI